MRSALDTFRVYDNSLRKAACGVAGWMLQWSVDKSYAPGVWGCAVACVKALRRIRCLSVCAAAAGDGRIGRWLLTGTEMRTTHSTRWLGA